MFVVLLGDTNTKHCGPCSCPKLISVTNVLQLPRVVSKVLVRQQIYFFINLISVAFKFEFKNIRKMPDFVFFKNKKKSNKWW